LRRPARPFRTAAIRYVAQRGKRGYFFGKSLDRARTPEFFQADDEGSIPFTRSTFVINELRGNTKLVVERLG
jgi:hypothetical protein